MVFGSTASLSHPQGLHNRRSTLLPQVFVANPNKTDAIVAILTSNKEKLLKYLGEFHTDKGELIHIGFIFRYHKGCSAHTNRVSAYLVVNPVESHTSM